MLGQGAVIEMSLADVWKRSPQKPQSHLLGKRSEENGELIQSFLVHDSQSCWTSERRPTRLSQPALADSLHTGAQGERQD